MSTPESKVKAATTVALLAMKAAGERLFWFFPIGGKFSAIGIPDVVGVHKGRFFAFEIKAEKGKATALQHKCLASIKSAGGVAAIIKPMEGFTIAEQVKHALQL